MSKPLTQSDLIFPTQSLSFSSTLSSLKRSALSIHNRLSSISSDSDFVTSVAAAYDLPLVANERCGSWYIPPEKKAGSVYFKSTDGHMNEWSFNVRRLNYQLLGLVGNAGGAVVVDSTRRGKSMPDALSKTVPIWCCVLNRALFPENVAAHGLFTSPQAVSASEHAQIEQRIDRFVDHFLDICKPDFDSLRQKVNRPLRPFWVIQSSTLPEAPPSFPDFYPVVLCTASRRVHGGEVSEGGYIQGAADDHEAWSHGLTPTLFWRNKDILLRTNEEDLPPLIADLLKEEHGPDAVPILIAPTSNLYISSSQNLDIGVFDTIISCTPTPLATTSPTHLKTKHYLHFPLQANKLGSRDLRLQLSRLPPFLSSPSAMGGKIIICDPTGKDLCIGVALALLCLYADEHGKFGAQRTQVKIDKTFIKRRLTWITTSAPGLNPSRETLKSVNAFLMPDPSNASLPPEPNVPPASKLTLVGAEIHSRDAPTSMSATLFAVLQNPNGTWKFTRTLTSALPTHPSGTVTGTATFTPLPPGSPSTLLYTEEGEFMTATGLTFTARRKYVYRLISPVPGQSGKDGDEEDAFVSVYFHDEEHTKNGNGVGVGELFVEMGPLVEKGDEGVWEAGNREKHLCGQDLYAARWKFGGGMLGPAGDEAAWWEVRYDVQGPKKDYVSETRYSRA